MKVHTLAREMIELADRLLHSDNIETRSVSVTSQHHPTSSKRGDEMVFGITTLAQLNKFSRGEWIDFIDENKLPIQYTSKDSSRNLIGKIISYLSDNEHEIVRLRQDMSNDATGGSRRLNQALNTLLKYGS